MRSLVERLVDEPSSVIFNALTKDQLVQLAVRLQKQTSFHSASYVKHSVRWCVCVGVCVCVYVRQT